MEERKKDHIDLAFEARIKRSKLLGDFYYEPLFARHVTEDDIAQPFPFAGKTMQFPLWVSSMTGGTKWAGKINRNLARACGEYGLGMGLGSCRILIDNPDHITDFVVREQMGREAPLMMNFGIAQLEEYLAGKSLDQVHELRHKLDADGLIIHVNPLQEWLQDEGDRFIKPPIETINSVLESTDYPVIVKEVGQGFGPRSLKALLALPLEAVEFGAAGGTNFSKLELMRSQQDRKNENEVLAYVGHSAEEMIKFVRDIVGEEDNVINTNSIIISGGIRDYMHAYSLIAQSPIKAIYGQASALLKRAKESYEELQSYLDNQLLGYRMAEELLDSSVEK